MAPTARALSQSDFQKINLSELRCVTGHKQGWMETLVAAIKDQLGSLRATFFSEPSKEPVVWVFPESGDS